MKEEDRKKIRFNIDYLASNTLSLLQLINLFREDFKEFSDSECETIESKPTSYERNTAFYQLLMKIGGEDDQDTTFETLLKNLRKSTNQHIERILRQDLDEHPGERVPLQKTWFDIKYNEILEGSREEEIKTIEDHLSHYSSRRFGVVLITGMKGIGKTELTLKFAQQFYTTEDGHCIFINAESSQTVHDSLRRLAAKLNTTVKFDGSKIEKPVKLLMLHTWCKLANTKSLIILDNLDSYAETLLQILDDCVYANVQGKPAIKKPFLLITSRNDKVLEKNWDEDDLHIKKIELGPLQINPGMAKDLIVKSLKVENPKPEDISKIQELCKILQGWPLALQQAIAYLKNETQNSKLSAKISLYLDSLDKNINKEIKGDEYFQLTYAQWRMGQEKIKAKSTDADKMLNIVSLFKSENLGLTFLTKVMTTLTDANVFRTNIKDFLPECVRGNTNKYNDNFYLLRKYHMLQSVTVDEEIVSLQKQLQSVILAGLKECDLFKDLLNNVGQNLTKMLSKEIELVNSKSDKPTTRDNVNEHIITLNNLIHIEMIWKHAVEYSNFTVSSCFDWLLDMADLIAITYNVKNRYTDTVQFCRESCKSLAQVSDNAKFKVSMKQTEVEALIVLGEYQEANKRVKEIVEEQKEIHKGKECGHRCEMCKHTVKIQEQLRKASGLD